MTTVPSRFGESLPRTLASLRASGFEPDRLFADGCTHEQAAKLEQQTGIPVTARNPALRLHGTWLLALYETFIRSTDAQRYLIVQDDVVFSRSLREYLDRMPWPDQVYLNLWTAPSNDDGSGKPGTVRKPDGLKAGWYPSNQLGKGALALAFTREGMLALLKSEHMLMRPFDKGRGWRSVDGGVVDSMRKAGFREYVHWPSLVQHIGDESSWGNHAAARVKAPSFRGEDFDCLELLKEM